LALETEKITTSKLLDNLLKEYAGTHFLNVIALVMLLNPVKFLDEKVLILIQHLIVLVYGGLIPHKKPSLIIRESMLLNKQALTMEAMYTSLIVTN
jgi:hypothetical protein